MTRARRIVVWLGAALALGVTFVAYLNPHLAVVLAEQIRSCF